MRQTDPGAGSTEPRAQVTSEPDSALLAPEATAIWFSPWASTTMRATPVAVSGQPRHAAGRDARRPERVEDLVGQGIVADRGHEPRRRAVRRRGHGLVGALATRSAG